MMMDAMALFTAFSARIVWGEARAEKVPEPEFKPFRFEKDDGAAVRAGALVAANSAREPRTLEELGVPGALARELEASFRLMGRTDGDRITGYTFRTADGSSHVLRTSTPAPAANVKAA